MWVENVKQQAQFWLDRARPGAVRDRQLAALILGLWAILTARHWTGHWAPDLSALWFAARAVADGMPGAIYAAQPSLFDPNPPAQWAAIATHVGAGTQIVYPYVYPPLWAHLFAPIAGATDPQGFFDGAILANTTLLAVGVYIAARIIRPAGMPLWVFAAVSVALLTTSSVSTVALFHNQPQIFVSVLVLLTLERHLSGDGRGAGLALALAASIKVGPALLVVFFILRRDWRALGWFSGAGLALGLTSIAVAGWPAHAAFLSRLGQIDGMLVLNRVNIALDGVVYEVAARLGAWSLPWTGTTQPFTVPQPVAIGLAMRALLICGFVWLWHRRIHRADRAGAIAAFIGLFILVKLTGPLAWFHHFLPVLLLLPGLGMLFTTPRTLALLALFGVAMSQVMFAALLKTGAPIHLTSLSGALILGFLGLVALTRRAPAGASGHHLPQHAAQPA